MRTTSFAEIARTVDDDMLHAPSSIDVAAALIYGCSCVHTLPPRVQAQAIDSLRDLARKNQLDTKDADSIIGYFEKSDALAVPASPVAPLELHNAADYITTEPPEPDQILAGVFDAGDKVPVIGASKTRKTFLVSQFALALAAGRPDFLGIPIPRPRRVLFVQSEVKSHHFHRRIKNLAAKNGISAAEIGDRLAIINARGVALDFAAIEAAAIAHRAEVIIIDPLYKLTVGDENSAQDMKPTLAGFDRLAEATGGAVVYVHHTAKGSPGDRDTRDRGAGSGVIARDYDAAVFLTEHRDCTDAADLFVVRFSLRNYPTPAPMPLRFEGGRFEIAPDVAPIERTSRNRGTAGKTGAAPTVNDALAVFNGGPLRAVQSIDRLRANGYTKDGARAVRDNLCTSGKLEEYTPSAHPRRIYYGTPEQIAAMKSKPRDGAERGEK